MCRQVYLLSPEQVKARIEATNLYYGGLDIGSASRIVIINGQVDPWHAVSLPANNNTDPMGITSILVKNAGHCPVDDETEARVAKIESEWLKDTG